jgi:maltose alpha-D-glucosyltransferase/alpha-amylase
VSRDSRLGGGSIGRAGELLATFRETARQGLLAGYADGAGAPLDLRAQRLLELFTLEKVAYEIVYEAANRPAWIDVPILGLAEIADTLLGGRGNG